MSTRESFAETPLLPPSTELSPGGLLESGRAPWPARILVCADDRPSTRDALTISRALAQRSGGQVEVLSVFAPRIPVPEIPNRDGLARCEKGDRSTAAEFLRAVRSQEHEVFDGRAPWSVHLEIGNPVRSILDTAVKTKADLVVVGLGDRDVQLRQRGASVPASLTRYVQVPMLASALLPTALPREAVVLIDREHPDPSIVRATLGCIEDAAVIWVLVHTDATSHADPSAERDKNPRTHLLHSMRRAAAAVSKDIVVREVHRTGDPIEAVLTLAREVQADLIVTAVHGTAGVVRALVPNIADQLLLTSTCSVLVVPESRLDKAG